MSRTKGMSPTQRTIRALKDQGMKCAIVERFNQYAGPFGVRQDLFNIIDIIALDPERGVVGIQACSADFKKHLNKICIDQAQNTIDWLSTPGAKLEVWGWRKIKLKKGGKAMRWSPRVQEVTLEFVKSFE